MMRSRPWFATPAARVFTVFTGYLLVGSLVFVAPGQNRPLATPDADLAARGIRVWQRENCASCHAVFGLGGHLGPDMVNVSASRGEDYIRFVLQQGAIGMPHFALSSDDVDALLGYMRLLDDQGEYPVRRHPVPLFGEVSP